MTERLRVDRSPVRLFLVGIVGLVLLVAAVDIMWGHWLSTPPDANGGVITTRGRAQQRSDYVWGISFVAAGSVLFAGALIALLRRRPTLVLYDDGVEFHVAGPERSTFVPWSDVAQIRSGRDHDEDASRSRDVLIVSLRDRYDLPPEPWGAEWVGGELRIDAEGWQPDVAEVAVHARLAMDEYRRETS